MAEKFPHALLEAFTAYDKYLEDSDHDSLMAFLKAFGEARKLFQQRQWRIYRTQDGGEYIRPVPLEE